MKTVSGAALPALLVFGEVVGIHIDPAYLKDGLFDTAAAQSLARCGYRGEYSFVSSVFQMFRPAQLPGLPAAGKTDDRAGIGNHDFR